MINTVIGIGILGLILVVVSAMIYLGARYVFVPRCVEYSWERLDAGEKLGSYFVTTFFFILVFIIVQLIIIAGREIGNSLSWIS